MQRLVVNEEHREASELLQQQHETSYLDFLVTHPPVFTKVMDLLEADSWLHMTEAKFDLLRCSEMQKMLFLAQHIHRSVSAWWVTYTSTLPN
jgi:hypothetical protein